MGGTIDGARGDHVIISPPYIAGPSDISAIVERLGDAVDAAVGGLEHQMLGDSVGTA